MEFLELGLAGLLAGVIDSIAGGGGLITLPALTLALGAGPHAIGTNKIAGSIAALVALVVYARGKYFDVRRSLSFAVWVAVGSFVGSRVSPILPVSIFQYLLFITCPLILYVVLKKDLWVKEAHAESRSHFYAVIASGLACGFYDGVWGPGGGTFMFLSLLFFVRLPLFTALAASKLANTLSASTALVSYSEAGFVHYREGVAVGVGIAIGAYLGATHASKRNADIVRPALAVVVTLLLVKLAASF